MFDIVFWRHVWRQKAHVFPCCNHLPNFGIWGFIFEGLHAEVVLLTPDISTKTIPEIEASNAEFGQVIAAWKYSSFLTPDMASKNDARHGIVSISAIAQVRNYLGYSKIFPEFHPRYLLLLSWLLSQIKPAPSKNVPARLSQWFTGCARLQLNIIERVIYNYILY